MTGIRTDDYDYIRGLVYRHSRIDLGEDKTELVATRLGKRLRALNLPDFHAYCGFLDSAQGPEELVALLDVISTNVTDFFREQPHFDFLAGTVLPEWATGRPPTGGEPLRVWSAACSSGEEPYSIAMVLAEFFAGRSAGSWQVSASDISTRMLQAAVRGIYRADRVKLPRPEWLSRYFQRGVGSCEGYCRVKRELAKQVSFHHLNLFDRSYPLRPGLDIIFCRNVMIYFDRATQEELIVRLSAQLKTGGYLFVGHSESLIGIKHQLACLRPSIYRRL
jgi:chemotaxis protein methyltransferase CheR